jgi:alpha-tubulin suppressor-like RCC1 family protein
MAYGSLTTNFQVNGVDIGAGVVTKEYLMDVYPSLSDTFRFAGLWGWGINGTALGDNTLTARSSPVQTIAGGTNWKYVAGYGSTSGGIKTNGTLWMWGDNSYGQLGIGVVTGNYNKSSPVQTIAGGTNWKQVAFGTNCTAAVKTDGTLWCWGDNTFGQLGTNDRTAYSSPVLTVAGGTNWKQVSCGYYSTGAIKSDGTLWIWGLGGSGQIGNNTRTNYSSPVQTIAGGTNWKQVSCSWQYVFAIKNDGTLWCWGDGSSWQLGTNNANQYSSPVQTIAGGTNWKQVTSGISSTAAIKTDGTLWTWGYNGSGELGTNNRTAYSSPVQTVAGGTNWKQVSFCGSSTTSTISAIKTDGTLWCWGDNTSGQLGTNNITAYSSPVQTVAGGTNWKYVACAGSNIFAIRDDSADIFGNSL